MRPIILLACAALATATSARDLPVPADKGWQHADSGLILPSTLDGIARRSLVDATKTERDVTADFETPDHSFDATVYIFHPAVDDVAIWFDRVQTAIMTRDTFGGVTPTAPAPIAFAPPGGGIVASALRQSYTPRRRPTRGTALAVIPIGNWLVVVRASSTTLSAAETDARMSRVIASMRWPQVAAGADAPAARPIAACAVPLTFGKAKPAAAATPDFMMALLADAVAQSTKATPRTVTRPEWCRDVESGSDYGVYRTVGYDKGYTMALGDAGRTASVNASFDTQLGKGNSYSVTVTDVDGAVLNFPSFDGMPSPDQVMKELRAGPNGRVTTAGHQTTIAIAPSRQ